MKTSHALILASLFAVSSQVAQASPSAVVHECGGLDSISNLVGQVKPFAGGKFRIAHVSTEEPAAAPDHLLIFVADENEPATTCFAISQTSDGLGFSWIDLAKLKTATLAGGKGLMLSIPVSKYDPEKGASKPAGRVKARVGYKNGQSFVTLEK